MSTSTTSTGSGAPDLTFGFEAELWESATEGTTWVFVSLPADQADEIADLVPKAPGFGSVRVEVEVGSTRWRTSLFPSSASGTYVLPVKKAVRNAERLDVGDTASVELRILLDEPA